MSALLTVIAFEIVASCALASLLVVTWACSDMLDQIDDLAYAA